MPNIASRHTESSLEITKRPTGFTPYDPLEVPAYMMGYRAVNMLARHIAGEIAEPE